MVKIPTPDEKAQRRLAGILEGYLNGESWAKERRLRNEVSKFGPAVLAEVLHSDKFSYLRSIDAKRLEHIQKKLQKWEMMLQI